MEKKEEILINVAKIISEGGMQRLTIDAVADQSNLTKGGVLYHFDSKEQLLLKMNEYVIKQYNAKINHFLSKLSGAYQFTRAYAMATLDMLDSSEDVLLPAVFITSQENEKSKQVWDRVSNEWSELFQADQGDVRKITELRMICDGVWFSMMYQYGIDLKEEIRAIIQHHCDALESEAL